MTPGVTMDPWLSSHYAGSGSDNGPQKIRRGGDTSQFHAAGPNTTSPSTPTRKHVQEAPAPIRDPRRFHYAAPPRARTRPWAWFALGALTALGAMVYLLETGVLLVAP